METGHEASHAFKTGAALPPLDEAGKNALHMHETRAKRTTPVVYASAILAVLALIALIRFPRPAMWLAFAVLLGNLISLLLAISAADAGGRIRHLELRPKTPWDEPAAVVPLTPSPTPSPTSNLTPEATTSM